jgi:hypothetical protein
MMPHTLEPAPALHPLQQALIDERGNAARAHIRTSAVGQSHPASS